MNKDVKEIRDWSLMVEALYKEESEPYETEEPEDLESTKGRGKITREKVIDWFRENPNPDDDALHDWAEEMGWDEHEVEEVVYNLVTDYVGMIDKEREPDEEEEEDED